MSRKFFRMIIAAGLMLAVSVPVFSQQAVDQYGFGNRVFMIQSAIEVGKSANGLWDIPGAPNKTDGNLKGIKWLNMQVWQRESGDPEDRVFRFRAAQGSAVGRYFISIGRNSSWGINAIEGTGAIEARSRVDHFELKHMGNGRWKIFYTPNLIVCLEANTAKNGTKLVLRPNQNGTHTEWVFFDTATNQSFIPASTSTSGENYSYKGKLEDAIASKHVGSQYFNYAVAPQFNSENSGGKLQAYLNNMDKAADQWTAILNLVNAIKQNKDTEARRSMYQAISEADIKRGSGFAENLLKGQVQKQINGASAAERDATAKGLLSQIAGKIQ